VKINHIYYWHNSFRHPTVEKTIVSVRYDPYDAGVAYAYVKGQWVSCISQYYSSFHGRSEREIFLATEELRQQYKQHSQKFTITAKALANFLDEAQTQESLLLQRLKDTEAKEILSTINTPNVSNEEKILVETTLSQQLSDEKLTMLDQNESEIIEPYEEKW
jgi:hypothetical protein